tara:strand:- start:2736 stop:3269 length:534 start_codon:yes stop_codon:yes gene_type:complete
MINNNHDPENNIPLELLRKVDLVLLGELDPQTSENRGGVLNVLEHAITHIKDHRTPPPYAPLSDQIVFGYRHPISYQVIEHIRVAKLKSTRHIENIGTELNSPYWNRTLIQEQCFDFKSDLAELSVVSKILPSLRLTNFARTFDKAYWASTGNVNQIINHMRNSHPPETPRSNMGVN